jgi:hypothetical protein
VQKTERNGQKEAGVRQESLLDRQKSRKGWEQAGIDRRDTGRKDMKGRETGRHGQEEGGGQVGIVARKGLYRD